MTVCHILLVAALSLRPASAAATAYWEVNHYGEFLKGRFHGVSLTRDGRLRLAPRLETLFQPGEPVIWNLARSADKMYVATGHRGQVYEVDSRGGSRLLWTASEPEVFALAVDNNGALFVGTSPNGKIYRIENGRAQPYFDPRALYIWSLAISKDGVLYAGTGNEGKVFRVTAANQGEVWYETGQTHVTALAFDAAGRLLAGTEPNAILYRITGKDKAFVLYDADLAEIRAIVPTADGGIYVAALGGAFAGKPAGAAAAVSAVGSTTVTASPTTITVTDASAQGGVEIKPKPEAVKPATAAVAPVVSQPAVDLSGGLKSAIYRIGADNLVETLWSSREENVYDLAELGSDILFATDGKGRIYRLESNSAASLLLETSEGETTRLASLPGGILAATSHAGKLLRLGEQMGESGTYESAVHDASHVARWGRIHWRAQVPNGSRLVLRTRSGNSARPDKTWSEWSAPLSLPGSPVPSPNARYIQWKAEFSGAQGRSPDLESVTIAYLPQNSPPIVKSIQVTMQTTSATQTAKPASSSSSTAYSITVTDSGETSAASSGNPTRTVARASHSQLAISWQAEDPDQDKLSYAVYFRGEEEREWKLLKKDWTEAALALDGESLADGRYFFRVVASDAPSNAAPQARQAELISAPFWIDNTPPRIVHAAPSVTGGSVELTVEAHDDASYVKGAEASIDAGPWITLAAEDGVADSRQERFRGRIQGLSAGEHLLVIRAYDAAGNAGLAKIVLR